MTQEKLKFSQWSPLVAEDFVKKWEGLRLNTYRCPGGVLTIGHGHTKGVKPGQTITRQEAEQLLRDDLVEHAEDLAPYVTCKLTEGQYIALLDLAFNLGVSAVAKSKTLGYLNEGKFDLAKEGFRSFAKRKIRDRSGNLVKDEHGKQMYEIFPGLMNRREDEVKLM